MQAPCAYGAGMKRRQTSAAVQYTLRNVPPAVDRTLRRRAAREAKSLNKVALEALARGTGVDLEATEKRDLDFLLGSWVEDPAVDGALTAQRRVDEDLWK